MVALWVASERGIPVEEGASQETTSAMSLERLGAFSDAWTAGDVEALMSFMTDDCVYYASAGSEPGTAYRGLDEVRRGFEAMLAYDRGRERHGGTAAIMGNLGIAEWSFEDRDADGRSVLIRGCDIFEFVGDKIRKKDAFRKVFAPIPTPANAGEREAASRVSRSGATHMPTQTESPVSSVRFTEPDEAARHFEEKMAHETDCADVWSAIEDGTIDFLIVDCRPAGAYAKAHIPGAVNLPWREISAERVGELPDLPITTYCWGPSCNAATKGALRLARLGRQVKEMIGGIEYWIREGHPTEGRRAPKHGEGKASDWGLVV